MSTETLPSSGYPIATNEQMLDMVKRDPQFLKEIISKEPRILNMIMADTPSNTKYVKLAVHDQQRMDEMRKKGVAEGVVIGLAVALFFAVLGEVFKK